ncbi:MAG: FHA domain-containing protein [Chloroflexi bacterium]|nr:FHA domain-containing protein [Chloroflexota bacterium]
MRPSRIRPFGITLLAFIFLFIAIVNLGLAAYVLVNPDGMMDYIALFERLQISAALINLLAAPPLITAGLAGLVFRGLWNQEPWAKPAVLTLLFFLLLLGIAGLAFLAAFTLASPSNLMFVVGFLLLCVVFFIYVWSVPFGEEPPPAPASPPQPELDASQDPVIPPAPSRAEGSVEATYHSARPAPAPPAAFVPPPPRSQPLSTGAAESPTVADESSQADATTRRLTPPAASAATQRLAPPTAALDSVQRPLAWLVVENGPDAGKRFPIHPGETLILGRDPARAQAILTEPTVSGRHALVDEEDGHFVLRDLKSTNGTYVHGIAVAEHALQNGDEIRLGACQLRFIFESQHAA